MNYLYIGIGAVLGAGMRHYIFSLFDQKNFGFPYHTIVVNIIGCILIGILAELFALKSHLPYTAKLLLVTGFLGSFTTFSTFALDTGLMIEKNEIFKSIAYVTCSVVLGLLGYFAASFLIKYLLEPK